jgi:hypothetical protein
MESPPVKSSENNTEPVGCRRGAAVVGELVVGGFVVGALVVGGLVVGALVVGGLVVGGFVVGAFVVGELVVGVVGATSLLAGAAVVGAGAVVDADLSDGAAGAGAGAAVEAVTGAVGGTTTRILSDLSERLELPWLLPLDLVSEVLAPELVAFVVDEPEGVGVAAGAEAVPAFSDPALSDFLESVTPALSVTDAGVALDAGAPLFSASWSLPPTTSVPDVLSEPVDSDADADPPSPADEPSGSPASTVSSDWSPFAESDSADCSVPSAESFLWASSSDSRAS